MCQLTKEERSGAHVRYDSYKRCTDTTNKNSNIYLIRPSMDISRQNIINCLGNNCKDRSLWKFTWRIQSVHHNIHELCLCISLIIIYIYVIYELLYFIYGIFMRDCVFMWVIIMYLIIIIIFVPWILCNVICLLLAAYTYNQ